ncbi:glycosyltransferase [Epibacterium ulvae]|uniref:glycosyltransferase n=1 Tax=Epibacterium ulvae TaxID=1156985 RepID=UPI001BFC47B6|nr:glycosyltransferase [Epibacterium ulvae]MBT8153947.1 glycosyltransferase [Epibacterium ulvae]
MTQTSATRIDAVIIGRNEGARLITCLASLQGMVARMIYVDSDSSDGSVEAARALGADVVTLDMSQPFTAARARNAGLARLDGDGFVQFVDGDCEVVADWITKARQFLMDRPDVAMVCGRRRERHPDASIYNRLCDGEWDTPVGEAKACGGDALMRISALKAVGGYRDDLIAGEEPEMCVRLRAKGWRIWRLEAEMTLHDAQMMRFGQWWNRSRRAGHAFAEGAALHGHAPEFHWVKETRRALIWGAVLPGAIIVATAVYPPMVALLAIYPLQILRLSRKMKRPEAIFSVIGKFAEALGALEFYKNRLRGQRRGILEYK